MAGSVEAKVEKLMPQYEYCNLLFVHRDADGPTGEHRYQEIRSALNRCNWDVAHVCVVPIQETEAWLLTSEEEIRAIAGNPRGRYPLELPKLSNIESCNRPKELLNKAYLAAGHETGRRRRVANRRFGRSRETLLRRLDPNGDVRGLSSFQRLVEDVESAMEELRSEGE